MQNYSRTKFIIIGGAAFFSVLASAGYNHVNAWLGATAAAFIAIKGLITDPHKDQA